MRNYLILITIFLVGFSSCRDSRIHDHPEWAKYFEEANINNGCVIVRDHNHEIVSFYNKERCLQRFSPASTFKIFNSLVALDVPQVAPDEQYIITWDSVDRGVPAWNKDMSMKEAFKVSNVGYYQELARRIGKDFMQHYLDTSNYGNKTIGDKIDEFWLDGSLQISADEQLGFVKKLYFNELPFTERAQRIVRSMMIQEKNDNYKLSYKTGWGETEGAQVLWVVGYIDRIEHMIEHENSMNKSDVRMYPYFFALNFEVPKNDESQDWGALRVEILKKVLKDVGALK